MRRGRRFRHRTCRSLCRSRLTGLRRWWLLDSTGSPGWCCSRRAAGGRLGGKLLARLICGNGVIRDCTDLNHNKRKKRNLLTAELENAFMFTARPWPMEEGDKSLDAASSSELPGRKVGMVTWHGASGANAQSKILLASIIHPFHSTPVLLVLSTPLTHTLPLAPLFSSLPRCRSHGRVSFPCFFSPFPGPLLLGGGGCSSVCPS